MTILNGRVVGVDEREFELRTGGDEEASGGKIRTASPEAVARFKAFLAAQPARPTPKPVSRPGVDPDARRRANEMAVVARAKRAAEMNKQTAPAVKPEEPKEQEEMAPQSGLSDEEIVAVHRRYVLENLAVSVLADDISLSESALVNQFKNLDLPCRARNRRWVSAADVERICEVHGLKIRDIPAQAMPVVEPAAKPKKAKPARAAVAKMPVAAEPVKETAVEPVMETAVTTQPASENGNGSVTAVDPARMVHQLEAIQQLMSTIGSVENIRVTGTIRIELSAEMVF